MSKGFDTSKCRFHDFHPPLDLILQEHRYFWIQGDKLDYKPIVGNCRLNLGAYNLKNGSGL